VNRTQGSIFDTLLAQTHFPEHHVHGACKSCGEHHEQSSLDLKQLQEQAAAMMQSVEHLMPLLNTAPPEVRDSLMRTIDLARQSISRRRP